MPDSISSAASHLQALIRCPSVTPVDHGAQEYLAGVLESAGFTVSRIIFSDEGTPDVPNLFATIGSGAPHLVFAGHTDVVPTGDDRRWTHPPFSAAIDDGQMFGRGAVDMKGGVAAFLAASLDALQAGKVSGTLSFLITGDEEGPAINGTVKLLNWALEQGHRFDAALVGEPTCREKLGDTIKNGRRGSLSGTIIVSGKQGHVAYPHLADNPLPRLITVLSRLTALELDSGTAGFQPSNLEVTGIDVDNPAFNVIPAEARARFNVRFNDTWTVETLSDHIAAIVKDAGGESARLEIERGASDWFLTEADILLAPLTSAIEAVTGIKPEATTGGGTSDARFFKAVCPVVEFGAVGDTMHQIDERIPLADLDALTNIYRRFIEAFMETAGGK